MVVGDVERGVVRLPGVSPHVRLDAGRDAQLPVIEADAA
jgi:hypothetical protein